VGGKFVADSPPSVTHRVRRRLANKGIKLSKPEYLGGTCPGRSRIIKSSFAAYAQCWADLDETKQSSLQERSLVSEHDWRHNRQPYVECRRHSRRCGPRNRHRHASTFLRPRILRHGRRVCPVALDVPRRCARRPRGYLSRLWCRGGLHLGLGQMTWLTPAYSQRYRRHCP
jgi:hypothetical protein